MDARMSVDCSVCGRAITVEADLAKLASHVQFTCDRCVASSEVVEQGNSGPMNKYRAVFSIYRTKGGTEEEELVSSFGAEDSQYKFADAIPKMLAHLNHGWEQVQKMADVIDED